MGVITHTGPDLHAYRSWYAITTFAGFGGPSTVSPQAWCGSKARWQLQIALIIEKSVEKLKGVIRK